MKACKFVRQAVLYLTHGQNVVAAAARTLPSRLLRELGAGRCASAGLPSSVTAALGVRQPDWVLQCAVYPQEPLTHSAPPPVKLWDKPPESCLEQHQLVRLVVYQHAEADATQRHTLECMCLTLHR